MDVALAISLALLVVESLLKLRLPSDAAEDVKRAGTILGRMRALADYSSEQMNKGPQVIQNNAKDIQGIVYDVEDALAKFMVKVPHHSHSNRLYRMAHHLRHDPSVWNASRDLSKRIKKIENEVSTFASDSLLADHLPICMTNHEEDCNNWVDYQQVLDQEDEVAGLEEAIEKVILQLEEGNNSKTPMISVAGPAGSGKTTLVKNVYKSTRVQGFFDCHAFVDVPSPFEPKMLLLNLLTKFEAQLIQKPAAHYHHIHHQQEEIALKADLEKLLEQKRYVVVLDNIRRESDLLFIVKNLPNGLLGSKIIITTRNSDILAPLHAKSLDYIHHLSVGLSSKEANKLFRKKAFHGSCNKCPPELEDLAEKILKKCEGVPLVISVVGTLLAQKPQNWGEWNKFHDSLGSNLHQIWDPSYVDLPDHLRSCFLYFSMFPEDYSVKRERLIRLWVAEGFAMQTRDNTMEEVADGYLKQLIGRNLIEVSSREIDGQVRSCRVSNLVREFIISKANNFITVLESSSTSSGGASTSSASSGDRIRRLSAHYVPNNNFSSTGGRDLNRTRTLLVFGHGQQPTLPHKYELEEALKTLNYLRVLDLKGVPLQDFPNSIVGLTILKYISMRQTKIKTIPGSIKKLAHLETLDLKRTQLTKLPKEIYELHKMRHLLVNHGCDHDDDGPPQGVEVSAGDIGGFSDLQKLSLIKVGNNRTILKALAELTGLKKLGLTELRAEHGTELCCAIKKQVRLSTLELRSTSEDEYLDLDHKISPPPRSLQRLSLKGRLGSIPQWIRQLDSVVKIGLKRSKLDADAKPLEALEALPNLMELDLVDYYTGVELIFKNGTFKMLKTLRIEQFDQLHMIKVGKEAMPKLKKLTMSNCSKLELLPLGIADLNSLEELFLYDMHREFISNLKSSEYRQEVQHIPVIHSFNSHTGFQNLSSLH